MKITKWTCQQRDSLRSKFTLNIICSRARVTRPLEVLQVLLMNRERNTLKRSESPRRSALSQLRALNKTENLFLKQKRSSGIDVCFYLLINGANSCIFSDRRRTLSSTRLYLLLRWVYSIRLARRVRAVNLRYIGRTKSSSRSLTKEVAVSGFTSVFLGLGAFFLFLSGGIYLWFLVN